MRLDQCPGGPPAPPGADHLSQGPGGLRPHQVLKVNADARGGPPAPDSLNDQVLGGLRPHQVLKVNVDVRAIERSS